MIEFEDNVIAYLGLPSIPKKEHDGKSAFDKGVAIIELFDGREAYAVCEYKPNEGQTEPTVTKVFGVEPFIRIKQVFVVPNYMTNVEEVKDMDLDEESKKKVESLLNEAEELENEGVEETDTITPIDKLPEWVFDEISNKEQALAWLKSWNKRNGIKKGRIPSTDENIKLRLYAIYTDMQKKQK